ncbi:MAG: hypothetical protein VX359_02750 [Chloroflexota bacterium]
MKLSLKYLIVAFLVFFLLPTLSIEANQFEINEEIQFEDLKKSDLQGRIIFSVKLRDRNNYDLWIMNADGGNIRHLTDSPANEINPSISPDGNHVAFAHDGGGDWRIAVMEIESGDVFDITFCCEDQKNPDWGENGLIAFQSNQEGNWSIWSKDPWMDGEVKGADKKEVSNIAVLGGVKVDNNAKQPAWNKNGRLLAFATDREGANSERFKGINRIWFKDMEGDPSPEKAKAIPPDMIKQGDSPEFYKGRNWYPNANGKPVIAYVQIQKNRPTIRWSNLDGSGGGRLTDQLAGNIRAKNPKFGPPGPSQEILGFLAEKNPDAGYKIVMWHIHDKTDFPLNITPPSMGASISEFDWGPFPSTQNSEEQLLQKREQDEVMRKMQRDQQEMQNNMRNEEEKERIRQNQERHERELEDDRKRLEMNQEMQEERLEMDRAMQEERLEMERERREEEMEMEREMTEMQMEADRERMAMEQQRREEQMAMDREQMEQQREMMKSMEGSGGRESFYEPEERCFVEDQEGSRGLFGNVDIGAEIDCGMDAGYQERLKDPATLAILGLVVTVGATVLQMVRGN